MNGNKKRKTNPSSLPTFSSSNLSKQFIEENKNKYAQIIHDLDEIKKKEIKLANDEEVWRSLKQNGKKNKLKVAEEKLNLIFKKQKNLEESESAFLNASEKIKENCLNHEKVTFIIYVVKFFLFLKKTFVKIQ